MTADRTQLRALAEKATPGPWRAANGKGSASVACEECALYINVRTCEVDECVERWQADASFIAAANPTAVLALLDEIERLREAERQARALTAAERLDHISTLGQAGELSKQLAEANAEIARLRSDGPTWLKCAVAILHDCVDQTDPVCPVGTALTRAGLERRPSDAGLLAGELHEQLAEMTAARDEACDIAYRNVANNAESMHESDRIDELRKVGSR